jgi:hypothetical protein
MSAISCKAHVMAGNLARACARAVSWWCICATRRRCPTAANLAGDAPRQSLSFGGGQRDLEPAVIGAHQGPQRRAVSPHSARSIVATDVRAARQPGTVAVRMARASADMATTVTVAIEIAGWGTT